MAKVLSSTTIAQGTRYSGNFNTDFVTRDVERDIYLIEPYNYPLFQYLYLQNNKSVMTGNYLTKHEWGEDELVPATDTLASAGTGGSTTMTIKPTETALYKVGTRVRFEETDETGTITAITPNIVATKDSGNWPSVAKDGLILILGESLSESATPAGFIRTSKVMLYNYCQIFSKFVSMSERAIMASMNGGLYYGNDWDYEMKKKATEMKRDIEMALWFNGATSASASNGVYTTRTGGVIQQITDN